MNKLFFVVPIYKVEEYLKRCVDSILSQTYPYTEIVLVDDGSPDNCPKICDEYGDLHKNIKVIHKQNGGLSDARNAGMKYVFDVADNEDYITFVDSDDFVHPEYAKIMIDYCEENKSALAQCGYEKGDKDFFETADINPDVKCVSAEDALLGYRIKSQMCAKLFKVRIIKDVFFPVGMINEDEFVNYRLVYNSGKVVFTDEKLYYYYNRDNGIMANVAKKLKNNPHRYDYLKAYEERTQFFKEKNLPDQVLKTREKICTDIILRYIEQMHLEKKDRDIDCINGTYFKLYKENYKIMMKRKGMPLKRRLMYISFYILPYSSVVMGKIFAFRK